MKQKEALVRKIDLDDLHTADLHPLAKRIVALLPDHETLTLGQIVDLTGGGPNTLKLRLRELAARGHLIPKCHGQGDYDLRARWQLSL